jgi:hypothetical protein
MSAHASKVPGQGGVEAATLGFNISPTCGFSQEK